MPQLSEITRAAMRHKAAILNDEREAATEMTRLYLQSYEAARGHFLATVRAIQSEAKATGRAPETLLYQRGRLETMVGQIGRELAGFSGNAAPLVGNRQKALLSLALKHAQELAQLQIPGLGRRDSLGGVPQLGAGVRIPNRFPTFRTLRTEDIKNVVGFTGNGSPLVKVLNEIITSDGARRFRETLVDGITRGRTDVEMTRDLARNMGAPYARTLTVMRTEGMRAYRESGRQFNEANPDLIGKVVWFASLSRDTCAACLLNHGREFPADYVMESHPNCRCVLIPKTKTFAEMGRDGKETELPLGGTGAAWFERQSDEVKKQVLGPAKFAALQAGEVELSDFSHRTTSAAWGGSYSVASLAQARENAKGRAG